MYEFIALDTDESGLTDRIDAFGLGHMASDAIRFCNPKSHDFDRKVSLQQLYSLSTFAQRVEADGDAQLLEEVGEGNFFPGVGRPSLKLIMFLSYPDAWAGLPSPFDQLRGTTDRTGYFDPVMIMVLGAYALAEIDMAAVLIDEGYAADAVRHVARASDALAYATGLSGYTEGDWITRTAETMRRKRVAARGGRARADRLMPVKKWVLDSFREKQWKSARQAAKELFADALQLSRDRGCALSEDRAFGTVYEWILKESQRI